MWTAKIAETNSKDGTFIVNVLYSNGTDSINEVIDMTGGSESVLSQKVSDRLDTLNKTEVLKTKISLGNFTPVITDLASKRNFQEAVRRLTSCQRAVSLGLIMETDKIFKDAKDAVIAAYDPSLIDAL